MIETGVKNDQGKTQWWYLDNFWKELEQVVEVLTLGDLKYPSPTGDNWKHVNNAERRYKDAMFRHMVSYRQGEKVDPESNKSHLAHVITNALFLMYFDSKEQETGRVCPETLRRLREIVEDIRDNCTNLSAPRSAERDWEIITPHLDAVLDEIEYLMPKESNV